MLRTICSRLLQSAVVMIGVTFLSFAAVFLTGNPAALMLGEGATAQEIAAFSQKMGFDRPLLVQYWDFISRAVRGDFGESLYFKESNVSLVLDRLPATMELAALSLTLSLLIAVPLGIYAASRRNSWADTISSGIALLGQATPAFWLGLMLILVFGVQLQVLPVSGQDSWQSYILPTFTLMTLPLSQNVRLSRSAALEVLGEDYIKTARSKGLRERVVLFKHVLKNSLRPVVTQTGLQLGAFLGGAVVIETIFAWPGLGSLAVQSITTKDFPLLQTIVTFMALVFVIVNLLVDLVYAVIDPRVRA